MTQDGILDHVMLRVDDLETALDWYTTHLDYEEKGRWEADTFTNVYLGPTDVHDQGALLELTYNHDGRTYDMGDAWGHIAVRVPEGELEAVYDELVENGVGDYRPPSENPGYAFVKDPDGHEIELVQRDHGAPFSIDHTMIRVEDADEAIGYWTRKFEYEHTGRWEADTFANYFLKPTDTPEEAMAVELTYNYDGRSYEMGDAWGHLAVRSEDLGDYWDALMTREAPDYRDPESCDWNYAFTKDPDGHEVEIVER
ncbi:MAG: VOC family protein [Halanaeroarchaeum sp.]